jgi:hypothetical protein
MTATTLSATAATIVPAASAAATSTKVPAIAIVPETATTGVAAALRHQQR